MNLKCDKCDYVITLIILKNCYDKIKPIICSECKSKLREVEIEYESDEIKFNDGFD
jgi:hypothetical protein